MALKLLTLIEEYFFELLFPVKCAACEKETGLKKKNRLVCSDCLKTLSPSADFFCPLCQAKTADARICFSCKILISGSGKNFLLDRLIYPFHYKNLVIQKIIKAFKYRFIKDLEIPLGRLVAGYFDKIGEKDNVGIQKFFDNAEVIVIPVPLHKRKFNQRGYNQSELIARKTAGYLGITPAADCLLKIKSTKDQARLKDGQRPENLKNAFVCSKPWLISGKNILLVDDVFTTGATMNECARVLKEAGAKEVIGLAIARG